jgi:branched-chain amino acid transport system substrate-binding protein
MKRLLPSATVLVTGALLLSACGSGSSGSTSASGGGGSASTTSGAVSTADCSDPAAATKKITGTLTVGWTAPLSGPLASAVDNVLAGMKARFAVTNAAGGIGGVKINVVSRDDAFDPSRAKTNVGQLIQSDHADVLDTFGSGQLDAVADDQNDACVPLLYGQASVPKYRSISDYPWTTEYLPSADVEMATVVQSLKAKYPSGGKIALAVNQTESGLGYATGLKNAIKGTNFTIVSSQPLTDPNAAAATLKATGAPILVDAGVTTDCLALSQAIGRVGWKPQTVSQPSNCADGATLYAPAGAAADGQQVMRWLKDPANSAFADDPAVKTYEQQAKANGASTPTDSYTVNGWVIADLMVDDFTRAAASSGGLSHLSIINAARTQNYQPPMFINGIKFVMTPSESDGILAMQPYTWEAGAKTFKAAGSVIDLSSQYAN